MERILCAAIWYDDGNEYQQQPKNILSGFVICGLRHGNCFATLSDTLGFPRKYRLQSIREVQGFLTSENHFVDRVEAMQIAIAANQVVNEPRVNDSLMSEDLY